MFLHRIRDINKIEKMLVLFDYLKLNFKNPINFIHQMLRSYPKFDFLDLKTTIYNILEKYFSQEDIDIDQELGCKTR